MKNEVRYVVDGGQPVHGLYSQGQPLRPDEICMAMEEGPQDDGSASVLGEVIDFLFSDGKPMAWGFVLRRLVALVGFFSPGAAAQMRQAVPAAGLPVAGGSGWGMDRVDALAECPERVRGLVFWCFGGGVDGLAGKAVRDGVARVYFLALGIRPEKLRKEGKQMTLEDFAEAFGESREGARARWSARGVKLLEGLPQMEWQRGPAAREKARVNALKRWEKEKS